MKPPQSVLLIRTSPGARSEPCHIDPHSGQQQAGAAFSALRAPRSGQHPWRSPRRAADPADAPRVAGNRATRGPPPRRQSTGRAGITPGKAGELQDHLLRELAHETTSSIDGRRVDTFRQALVGPGLSARSVNIGARPARAGSRRRRRLQAAGCEPRARQAPADEGRKAVAVLPGGGRGRRPARRRRE
jgi:hypothetical protein